jgi:alginate O-acetyltransferase complex protein AlgI
MIVMVLGGLWHGANWTFAVWGALHGIYLAVEHLLTPSIARWSARTRSLLRPIGILVTFHLTCIAWVFFRMPRFAPALDMLRSMLIPDRMRVTALGPGAMLYITAAFAATLIAALFHRRSAEARVPAWAWGASAALMLFFIVTAWADASQFIYFQF